MELFFHCTAVADGSRTIAVGAPVVYQVVAGHLGRWEADELRPTHPARAGARTEPTATTSSDPPVTSTPPAR